MFGYVKVRKGELKVREWEAYRGVYCSLCRALGKRYGVVSRLILSYDMTFFALVRMAQSGTVPQFRPGRCPFQPAKRCNYCQNAETEFDFVCATAVLMFYYKVKDNILDSGFLKRILMYLLLPVAALWRRKAKRLFPETDKILALSMKQQKQTEEENTDSFDKAAHASADALGKLTALGGADDSKASYRFGYCVGRWVYLTDAADDIESDLKHKNYNVFVRRFLLTKPDLSEEQKEQIRQTLQMSCANAIDAMEQCSWTVMRPILENILYDGMHMTMERILKGGANDAGSL